MTSPSPLLYNTFYHIYNRGNNRENIFIQERNYEYFLNLFWKYIEPITDTFAFCLLRNHFHLLVRIKSEEEIMETLKETLKVSETPETLKVSKTPETLKVSKTFRVFEGYPSKRFSDFFNAYSKAINKAYGRTGSLFQHSFSRAPITTDRQFWNVIAHIHQNPQKHKFVQDFREWKWSS